MRREESGTMRSTSVSRSYSHAGKCFAVSENSRIHGISQGKEQPHDIGPRGKLKEQTLLGQRVVCGYDRPK